MMISFVRRCYETETRDMPLEEIFSVIRTGKHDLKQRATQIHNRFESELEFTGSLDKAKKAISELKQELPMFLPSGTFSERASGKLIAYSGLLMADIDGLEPERLLQVKEVLKTMPFVEHAEFLHQGGD